jgi:hypothetical protein
MSPQDNVRLIQKVIQTDYTFCETNRTKVARKLYTEIMSCDDFETFSVPDPLFTDFLSDTAEFCVRAFKAIPPGFYIYLVKERIIQNFVH